MGSLSIPRSLFCTGIEEVHQDPRLRGDEISLELRFIPYFTNGGNEGVGVTTTGAERFGILKNGVPV